MLLTSYNWEYIIQHPQNFTWCSLNRAQKSLHLFLTDILTVEQLAVNNIIVSYQTISQYWCRKYKNATGNGGDYKCFGPCSTCRRTACITVVKSPQMFFAIQLTKCSVLIMCNIITLFHWLWYLMHCLWFEPNVSTILYTVSGALHRPQ